MRFFAFALLLLAPLSARADEEASPPPATASVARLFSHLPYAEADPAMLMPVPSLAGCTMAREVVFVLLPNLVLLDLAGPADAFRNANLRMPGSYRLRFTAPQPSVVASVGLSLAGLEPLPARLVPGTILVLTGISGDGIDPHEPRSWAALGTAAIQAGDDRLAGKGNRDCLSLFQILCHEHGVPEARM